MVWRVKVLTMTESAQQHVGVYWVTLNQNNGDGKLQVGSYHLLMSNIERVISTSCWFAQWVSILTKLRLFRSHRQNGRLATINECDWMIYVWNISEGQHVIISFWRLISFLLEVVDQHSKSPCRRLKSLWGFSRRLWTTLLGN